LAEAELEAVPFVAGFVKNDIKLFCLSESVDCFGFGAIFMRGVVVEEKSLTLRRVCLCLSTHLRDLGA